MEFIIHKDYVGYNNHILVKDDKLTRVSDITENSYVFGHAKQDLFNKNLNEVFKLNGFICPAFPEEKYVKSIKNLVKQDTIVPWCSVIPKNQYIKQVNKTVEEIKTKIASCNFSYYEKTYQATNDVLKSLRPCKVNGPLLQRLILIENNAATKTALQSFTPDNVGFIAKTKFSRDTKTGRLKVESGANILHLKKDYRKILRSRFGDNGDLYYLDYKSLEPRTMLAINKPNTEIPLDIYKYVLNDLEITNIPREVIKQIILTQLYGASEETIIKELHDIKNPYDFIKLVSDFFGTNKLKNELLDLLNESKTNGILNHYGRWIDCNEVKPYMIVNYFIQSTSVDVAMLGFSKIIKYINNKIPDKIIPIFPLHDALILDVHHDAKNYLNYIVELGSQINNFENVKFYLECKKLN